MKRWLTIKAWFKYFFIGSGWPFHAGVTPFSGLFPWWFRRAVALEQQTWRSAWTEFKIRVWIIHYQWKYVWSGRFNG